MTQLSVRRRFDLATDGLRCGPRLADALAPGLPLADWNALRATKALPKGDDGFVVQYTLPLVAGGTLHLGAHLVADPLRRPAWAAEKSEGVTWIADLGLAVAAVPSDPTLRQLPTVVSAAWRRALADQLGWECRRGRSGVPECEVLAYRLKKRCVLRLACAQTNAGAHGRAVVKVVRPDKLVGIVAAHAAVGARTSEGASYAVPRVLHVDADRGAFVMEEAVGATLLDLTGRQGHIDGYTSAGHLLREFHTPAHNEPAWRSIDDELAQLHSWTALAADLFPQYAAPFKRRYAYLANERVAATTANVTLHRDFYDKQILIGRGRATLLDLDTVTTGDPALDLGNFLAHVRLRQLQLPRQSHSLASAGRAFLAAYGTDLPLMSRVRWWRAATLLRLAALYALRPRWRQLTPTLLEEVDTCLRMSASRI